MVGLSFIATGSGTGTGFAANTTYEFLTVINGNALSFTPAGDESWLLDCY